MFDYFVELFCDFRRIALGESGQLFNLYTKDANILRDMVSPLLGHLEGGCKIDILWAAWADSRGQISEIKAVHCAEGCRARLNSIDDYQPIVAGQFGNDVHCCSRRLNNVVLRPFDPSASLRAKGFFRS
jgi:hypothetical protein